MLRFRLAALKNIRLCDTIAEPNIPITTAPSPSSKSPAGTSSKALEPKNEIVCANRPTASTSANKKLPSFPDKIVHKKRAHESLSSSDTSIASYFEEVSVETDEHQQHGTNVRCALNDSAKKGAIGKASGAASGKENRVSPTATVGSACQLLEMPAMRLRITYRLTNSETKLLRRVLNSHGLQEVDESKDANLLWSGGNLKTDLLRYLKPYQRVNHFPR